MEVKSAKFDVIRQAVGDRAYILGDDWFVADIAIFPRYGTLRSFGWYNDASGSF